MIRWTMLSLALLVVASQAPTEELSPQAHPAPSPELGKQFLEERCYIPALWSMRAYRELWKQWGVPAPPADYAAAVRERYGLHVAPYANGDLPMGLREARGSLVGRGVAVDCMVCHGGSIMGKSYVGLGNTALDIHALFEELTLADGGRFRLPFTFTNTRGTNEAGAMSVFLLGLRTPELGFQLKQQDLGLKDDLCEDVPAWWLLGKKQSMYFTGGADARSVRSIMQFMMGSLNTRGTFEKHEADFRHIHAYLRSMHTQAPKYPLPIDRELAKRGEVVFRQECASCHGTYGPNWTYPNRIIPLDVVGTDPKRFEGISEKFGAYYNRSWFARERDGWFMSGYKVWATEGYQAPPLDGIWATAPYLHNGSVPTLYHLLKSSTRPKVFTRSFRTELEDYDSKLVGWKVREVPPPAADLPPIEFRKVYDTTKPGRSNAGHTFGDDLTEEERWAVIEYLKTL